MKDSLKPKKIYASERDKCIAILADRDKKLASGISAIIAIPESNNLEDDAFQVKLSHRQHYTLAEKALARNEGRSSILRGLIDDDFYGLPQKQAEIAEETKAEDVEIRMLLIELINIFKDFRSSSSNGCTIHITKENSILKEESSTKIQD
jgi:hypothetical protein